jgi:hypothetical protein
MEIKTKVKDNEIILKYTLDNSEIEFLKELKIRGNIPYSQYDFRLDYNLYENLINQGFVSYWIHGYMVMPCLGSLGEIFLKDLE